MIHHTSHILVRHNSAVPLSILTKVMRHMSSGGNEQIVIPNKIKRGPTDILKALSSTVKPDPTAAHYKYHDDPYLIPFSNPNKRIYAMAKESGCKAARWIQAQNPELFQHKVSKPLIKDFVPPFIVDENVPVDEETLKYMITSVQVTDAIKVFELLEKEGKAVSTMTKQSLLELLCFYNCEDTLQEAQIEERWYQQNKKNYEKTHKTWKDNGFAEKLFHSLEPKDSAAYNAVIQGRARYLQADGAWQLYEEATQKGIHLCTETFNALISVVSVLRESPELARQMMTNLLTDMEKYNLRPNIHTLNSVLSVLSSMGSSKNSKSYALSILAEFKSLNINPSLTSYYYLLLIFCQGRGPKSSILLDIMDLIEGRELPIQDIKDTFFFMKAMETCRNHLQDKDLAYRVDNLLWTGNNYHLIGDSFKESVYYRHFFMLVSATEPVDVFMQMYDDLIPNVYTPEPSVFEAVIDVVAANGAVSYLPRLWSDAILFDHTERENIVAKFLTSMIENLPSEDTSLKEQCAHIAWNIWNRLENTNEARYRQLRGTGHMLGDIITLLLKADKFNNACIVMNKLVKQQHTIVGVPRFEALQLFLDACIVHADVQKAVVCIEFCADAAFPEIDKMVKQVQESLSLNREYLVRLNNVVSSSVNNCKDDTNK